MVELTLSSVARASKFAPAPKARPRGNRAKAAGPTTSAPPTAPVPNVPTTEGHSNTPPATQDPLSQQNPTQHAGLPVLTPPATQTTPTGSVDTSNDLSKAILSPAVSQLGPISSQPHSTTNALTGHPGAATSSLAASISSANATQASTLSAPPTRVPATNNVDLASTGLVLSQVTKPVTANPLHPVGPIIRKPLGPKVVPRNQAAAPELPSSTPSSAQLSAPDPQPAKAAAISAVSGGFDEFVDSNNDHDYTPQILQTQVPTRAAGPPRIFSKNAPPTVLSSHPPADTANITLQKSALEIQVPTTARGAKRKHGELRAASTPPDDDDEEPPLELNEETIPQFTIAELIFHKFTKGKLSRMEQLRLQQQEENKRSKRESSAMSRCSPSPAPSEEVQDMSGTQNFSGPRLVMIDGQMQLDTNSLVIHQNNGDEDLEQIDEGAQRLVTSASFRMRKQRARVKWTAEWTERFYDGLSYFGTDFSMICLMFPGLTRAQLKAKYNVEERVNAARVTSTLLAKKSAPSDLIADMKERVKDRVAKRDAAADGSGGEEEAVITKDDAAAVVGGATAAANGEVTNAAGSRRSDVVEEEDNMDQDESSTWIPPQTEEDEAERMWAPTNVDIAFELPLRPLSIIKKGIKPKAGILPKGGRRRRVPATPSTSSTNLEAAPAIQTAMAAESVPVATSTRINRKREIPTIGIGK